MPVIPYRRQVNPQAIPTPYYGGGAPSGEAIGRGLENLGGALQDASHVARVEANQTRLSDLIGKYDAGEHPILHGPEGAFARVGEDVIGLDQEASVGPEGFKQMPLGDLRDIGNSLLNSVTDPEAKRAFSRELDQRYQQTRNALTAYQGREWGRYSGEIRGNAMNGEANRALANFPDDAIVTHAVDGIGIASRANATAAGISSQEADAQAAELASKVLAGIADRRARVNTESGQRFYETNKDRILGADRLKFEDTLRGLSDAETAETQGLKIYDGAAGDETKAYAAVDVLKVPAHVKDAIRSELAGRFNRADSAQRATDRAAWDSVYEDFAKGRSLAAAMKSPGWPELSPEHRERFADMARERTGRDFSAADVSPATLERWRQWNAAPIEERGDPNRWNIIAEFHGKVPVEWERQMLDEQGRIQDAQRKPQKEAALDEIETKRAHFHSRAEAAGIFDESPEYVPLLARYEADRKAFKEAHGGKRLTQADEDAILTPLLVKTVTDGWLSRPVTHYGFQQAPEIGSRNPEIPADARAKIEAYLRANPTDHATVEDIYRDSLGAAGGR